MEELDGIAIREQGVVRLSARQITELWLEVSEKCAVDALVDIQQPESFTGEVEWSLYSSGNEKF